MASPHIDTDQDIHSALPDGQEQTPTSRPPRAGDGSDKPDLVPSLNFDTGAVLDDLFKQSEPEPKPEDKPKADAPKADASKADEKPKADAPKADASKVDEKPKADAPKLEDKPKVEDKPKTDVLDSVELPPQAKARSGEAFAKVKELARQEIKKRDEQITGQTDKLSKTEADLAAARKELESRPTVDPAVEKELTDLRNWRKQIDVEADPKWSEFDTRANRNREAIIGKLIEHGMPESRVAEVKRLNFEINWDDILPKLPSQARRFIESKLVENESLDLDKKEAIKTAKSKADEFLKERSSSEETRVKQAIQEEQKVVDHFLGQLDWIKKQEVKADAPAEQKAQIESANKFVEESNGRLKQLMGDRSPNTRAQMIVGTLLAYKYKADLDAKEKEVASLKAAHDSELEKIREDLKTATEELQRIKKASGAGRKPSLASTTVKPTNDGILRPGADALDQLRSEVQSD